MVDNVCSPNPPRPSTCISLVYRSGFHLKPGSPVEDEAPGGLPLDVMMVATSASKLLEYPFLLKDIRSSLVNELHYTMDFCFASPSLARVAVSEEDRLGWPDISTTDRRMFLCSPKDWTTYFVTNQHQSSLGFTELETNVNALTVRKTIQSMLLKESNLTLKHFRMPNGYPLSVGDEQTVRLFDISSPNRRLVIITENKLERCDTAPVRSSYSTVGEGQHGSQFVLKEPQVHHRTIGSTAQARLPPPLGIDQRLSFNTSKNMPRLQSPMTISAPGKKFLISYVQKEGRDRAIMLKTELELHGCSVFLDFENIAGGMDWQDILNNAVKVCEVFVPLVTDSYGETLWTNREVKLADVMKKVVVPVSLIDTWPPSCLAIQFCTTQHVRWKSIHDDHESGSTPPETEKERVRYVAKEILDLYRKVKTQNITSNICMTAMDVETPPFDFKSAAKRRRSTVRCYPYESGNSDALEEAKQARDGRPLIVVCAHISQGAFVETVRNEIGTSKYDVWSTTDTVTFWPDPALRENAVTPTLFEGLNRSSYRYSQANSSYTSYSGETMASTVSPAESIDGCLFQEKADEAAIVVLVLSAAFASSSICKHFLFYVERRKRFIPVIFDDFPMPGWMTTLIGTRDVEDAHSKVFVEKLRLKLNRAVNLDSHAECTDEDLSEANILRGVEFLLKNHIPRDRTVYISGSGSQGLGSAFLAREIAEELAKLPGLCIATGGCLGVGETLSSRLLEVRKNNYTSRGKMPECVYHVLPCRDDSNQKEIASQNADGTFNPAATGRTYFFGKSLRERETVVGRYFKVCLLIDGDTHAAHEASEAMWADNIVLPVYKSGGAAGGDFDFRMDKAPVGVSDAHWAVLRSKESTDQEIAVAIREILEIMLPEVISKENVKKHRTPKTPKPKARTAPLTPSSPSPYGLRDRTGKKRMFDTDDSPIMEEHVSASKF